MANAPIGGNFLNSFLAGLYIKPYSGSATTFTSYASQSGGVLFDVVKAEDMVIRHLDNATTSGLWFHRGTRQTAKDAEIVAKCKFSYDTPLDDAFSYSTGLTGYQVYALLGSNPNQTISSAYYWMPSMFVNIGKPLIDVASVPPKLVEVDIKLMPNGPCFYIDGSPNDDNNSGTIGVFSKYIQSRSWVF